MLDSTSGPSSMRLARRVLPGAHVEALLAAGADPNVTMGTNKDTPLMIACRFDQVLLVVLLPTPNVIFSH